MDELQRARNRLLSHRHGVAQQGISGNSFKQIILFAFIIRSLRGVLQRDWTPVSRQARMAQRHPFINLL